MRILAIETSCDETAVAVIEVKDKKIKVLSNTVSSQVKIHAKYGGVVPNLAAREHVKNIKHVFNLALKEARLTQDTRLRNGQARYKIQDLPVDLIAVTRGPGLGPALLVGISFARALSWKHSKPLIGVNHLEGHIYSNWLPSLRNSKSEILNPKQYQEPKTQNLEPKTFPILNVIVSGGHTELVLMKDYGKYELVGETLDDAIGEAFDKVARLLGLGYPGGPAISARAHMWNDKLPTRPNGDSSGRMTNNKNNRIHFPRPMEHSKDFNFSYSGLKTSVLYKVRELSADAPLSEDVINEICYEFQKAATEVIVKKALKACKEFKAKSLFLSGGVSANKSLREELAKTAKENGLNYSQPELEYTGDNAAMIGLAGYFNSLRKKPKDLAWDSFDMDPNLGF